MSTPPRGLNPVVFPRLLIGWVVLICAEGFSGASLGMGFWHPWTLIVTYWLYFGHFFLFTTLAVRTGRTSLPSLYLWGVLFGLYESWITKVIWSGYSADATFVLGKIGPYGFAEISMVLIFHPVVSFLLPLAVACVLCPSLRRWFPDVAWFTSPGKWARAARGYMILSFGLTMGLNSGGPVNLALNLAFLLTVLGTLVWLARPGLAARDGRPILDFGQWGFVVLCLYMAILYGLTYRYLRFEALPSIPVQLLTFVFYAITIAGLWRQRRRDPLPDDAAGGDAGAGRTLVTGFALVVALAFLVSVLPRSPLLYLPFGLNSVVWTVGGFVLTGVALWTGRRESGITLSRRP